jgi:hypothetical protein
MKRARSSSRSATENSELFRMIGRDELEKGAAMGLFEK